MRQKFEKSKLKEKLEKFEKIKERISIEKFDREEKLRRDKERKMELKLIKENMWKKWRKQYAKRKRLGRI